MTKWAIGRLIALGSLALAVAPAQAAVIVQNFHVSAVFIQQTAPIQSVTFDFTLTYDPLVSYSRVAVPSYTTTSTAASFNPSVVLFESFPGANDGNILQLVGDFAPGQKNGFYVSLVVDNAGQLVRSALTQVEYSLRGGGNYNDKSPAITITSAVAGPVPEPTMWAMFIFGFGAVGTTLRRRMARVRNIATA